MRNPSGFTLVEVVVALALTGMVTATAYALYGGVSDGVAQVEAAAEKVTRGANRRAWLTHLFGAMATGVADSTGFHGRGAGVLGFEADELRFAAYLGHGPDAGPTRVRLSLVGDQVHATLGASYRVVAEAVSGLGLDYLPRPGASALWLGDWDSPASAPVAVRMRVQLLDGSVDTLLLPCGALP